MSRLKFKLMCPKALMTYTIKSLKWQDIEGM